jgi:predicted Zn-dependent protease
MVEDKEFDADIVGAVLAVGAGFNPYALAGWLARAAMVTGTADLRSAAQAEFDSMLLIDAHSSINQRITEAFNNCGKCVNFLE